MIDGGLSKLFQEHLRDIHWQRVETWSTGFGVPDLNGCGNGVEFWIECKQTDGCKINLRPEQIAWAMRRMRAGGRVYIAVRRKHAGGKRKGGAIDELWLYPGSAAQALAVNRMALVRSVGFWPGGPARWPWPIIRKTLLTP